MPACRSASKLAWNASAVWYPSTERDPTTSRLALA